MNVEEAVFWQFAQFIYTGLYTDFALVREDGPCYNDNANNNVASGVEEQTYSNSSGEYLL